MKSPPRPLSAPPEALCWVRVETDCHMLALTGDGGPRWSAVIYRSTYNQDTGELVHEEAIVPGTLQEHLHRLIDKTDRMETHLWYIPDPIEVGNVVALKKMVQPSKSQIREHELQNHAVFRDWCKVCIEARATGSKHKKKTPEQRAEQGASIHSDFFFMEQATFLAIKSCPSGRLHAVALPSKENTESRRSSRGSLRSRGTRGSSTFQTMSHPFWHSRSRSLNVSKDVVRFHVPVLLEIMQPTG